MKPIRLSLFSFTNPKEYRTLIYIIRNTVYILLVFAIMMSILESAKLLNEGKDIRLIIHVVLDVVMIVMIINDTHHIISFLILQSVNVALSIYILMVGGNISPYRIDLKFLSRKPIFCNRSIIVLTILFIILCSLWYLMCTYELYKISIIHALISAIVMHVYVILIVNRKVFIILLDRVFGA